MWESWPTPGYTARLGQPVEKLKQASYSSPKFKNQFNIDGSQMGLIFVLFTLERAFRVAYIPGLMVICRKSSVLGFLTS